VIGNITRDATGFATNLAGPWHPAGGTWTAPGDGVHAQGSGDSFYLSSATGSDFTYEGDNGLDWPPPSNRAPPERHNPDSGISGRKSGK
jgi:hypothetical protein